MANPAAFKFKVVPWKHQRTALRLSAWAEAFALLMQQGTGKSKVLADNAGMLFLAKKIQAMVILAPDGVQRAWVRDMLPAHMSPSVQFRAAWWDNTPTKKQARAIEMVHDRHFNGLRILAVNYEALATKKGLAGVLAFMAAYDCLAGADESHRIKNHKGVRSEAAHKIADKAAYRRILTGTPVALSPIDVYGQFLFLDPQILGNRSFVAFKAHYAVLEGPESHLLMHIKQRLIAKYGEARARFMMPQLIKRDESGLPMYRNLDELNRLIKPHSYRVLKEDCLDLPPKVYQKRYVTLNTEQRRIYNELRDDYIAQFGDDVIVSTMAMTRLTRLQQITGGFFQPDTGVAPLPIGGANPKLVSLLDAVAETGGKVLIWARFVAELELIADALEEEYGQGSVARYWGNIGKRQRDEGKARFTKEAICRFFVAQPKAGGTGLDGLQVADTEVYFSNETSLIDRLQSEDRGHRGGSEIHKSVTIIDIEAEDTLDRRFIDALRNHKNVADAITGDSPRNWL